MRADTPIFSAGRRRARARAGARAAPAAVLALIVAAVLVGLAFAGSSSELAEGTRVAGVDVGGLTEREAAAALERRFERVADDPVTFLAGGRSFRLAANQLGVHPDFRGAVAAAARAGSGFGPIRGFRRLHVRVFGAEVSPRVAVSRTALDFALDRIARAVEQEPREAALVLRGLRVETIPGRPGRRLRRELAAWAVVGALASLERAGPVMLPVADRPPRVRAAMLEPAARLARRALSGPVRLRGAGRTWLLPRTRIASILALPTGGETRLAVAGPGAERWLEALAARVERPARDAGFAVAGERVEVVPARPGRALDRAATAQAVLRAAISPGPRVAELVLVRVQPERTTREALAMGIDRLMGTYKTFYAGTADRITNLRLGVTYLDGALVPPGGTFSLNRAIGERTVERGFRPAPVIIGTRYEEEIGGGTSQVATTVFNAAWEAGLRIVERNPHSLYIGRYPLGRDATVYWPSLDLRFVNDTSRWVLVKGFVEWDGIRVSIYGGETRRVESSPGTRVVTGRVPVKRVKDPTLPKGQVVVEEEGTAPTRTTVTRAVYSADGELLRRETWVTSYKGEPRVLRVGTKPEKVPREAAPAQGTPVPGERRPGPRGEGAGGRP